MTSHDGGTSGRILAVCTGNVCRSPYIARRLAAALNGTGIVTSSAGTDAAIGSAMDPRVADRLVASGADTSEFHARQVTEDMIAGVDLVLCATRHHRGQIVTLEPRAVNYTYALTDFADICAVIDAGELAEMRRSEANMVQSLSGAATITREHVDPRNRAEVDIPDPFGRGAQTFELAMSKIDAGVTNIVRPLQIIR